MTCVAGELLVTVAGTDRVLREGDTVVIPANTTHTILNQGTEPATCRVTYEPAGRNEDWFRLIHGFAYVHGREPGLLDMAPFLPDVDILVPQPPEAIQRFTVKWVMRPLGILLGRRRRMLATAAQAYGRPVTW